MGYTYLIVLLIEYSTKFNLDIKDINKILDRKKQENIELEAKIDAEIELDLDEG